MNSRYQFIFLLIVIIFLVLSLFMPVPQNMGDKGLVTIAILFVAICLWFTNIIPPAITSLLVIVLLSLFGVLTFEEATSGLGKDVIYLIIAMLIMSVAVEKVGMDKRLAYNLILLAKGNTRLTVLILIFTAFLLTFFIPNGLGRLAVLLPIAIGLIDCMKEQGGENVGKAIILSITYTPWVCTVFLITGATGSIYAASLFEKMVGFSWSYLYWFIVMLPGTLIILFVLWLVLIWLFPPLIKNIEGGQQYFEQEKRKLGVISTGEIKLISLYTILILLWITKDIHHLSISMSAVLIVVFLFIPGIELLTWKEAVKQVDWSVPLLFATGFTLATAFEKSGVLSWGSSLASNALGDLPIFILALTLMILFVIIRIGFTNYSAMVASLLPVALTFALGTPFNPVWLGMVCLIASTTCYLFPSQSIGNMTTFTLGYYTSLDMLKAGSWLTITIIIVTLVCAFFYWPKVGLPIYLSS